MAGTIDYKLEGDHYHKIRHPEIFGNSKLISAWSHYASDTYFPGLLAGETVLEMERGPASILLTQGTLPLLPR